jgi:hypothetical protein
VLSPFTWQFLQNCSLSYNCIVSSTFLITDAPVSDWLKDVDIRVQYGLNFGQARGFIRSGDTVVVVTGWKQGSGFTNTLRLVYVELEITDVSDIISETDSEEGFF